MTGRKLNQSIGIYNGSRCPKCRRGKIVCSGNNAGPNASAQQKRVSKAKLECNRECGYVKFD